MPLPSAWPLSDRAPPCRPFAGRPQVHSARNTAAQFSFGTSERHRPELRPKKTMYTGKDFERQNWGIHSPGPSQYNTKATIGSGQVVPQYKASPAFSFGSEDRFAY